MYNFVYIIFLVFTVFFGIVSFLQGGIALFLFAVVTIAMIYCISKFFIIPTSFTKRYFPFFIVPSSVNLFIVVFTMLKWETVLQSEDYWAIMIIMLLIVVIVIDLVCVILFNVAWRIYIGNRKNANVLGKIDFKGWYILPLCFLITAIAVCGIIIKII